MTTLLVVTSNVPAETCIEVGDPAGNFFPQGFCTPTDPGRVSGEVDIKLEGLEFRVPDDGRLDVIVPLTKGFACAAGGPVLKCVDVEHSVRHVVASRQGSRRRVSLKTGSGRGAYHGHGRSVSKE